MYRVAIDTGGTFTDFVLHDLDSGHLHFWKTLSTPQAPEEAVLRGLTHLQQTLDMRLADVEEILLATTVATNAIIERKGSHTGLLTTRGFRDVLIMGRQKRYDTYDLYLDKPRPLVARRHIKEVDERTGFDGRIIRKLDTAGVDRAIAELLAAGVESIAVSLLHAYANPAHEVVIGEHIQARAPGISMSLSSDVSPKFREYERTSTTVANAYIKPMVERYLAGLRSVFSDMGFAGDLYIMQSNGGLITTDLAARFPVHIVESGPSAGVLMCGVIGRAERFDNILTFDMGGTTAKVGAMEGGEPVITSTFEVDGINLRRYSGLPLNIPAIELVEIGAGGGSIATTHMGLIQVGPESAGAEPGPVCYGNGGERLTLTDANLILGYIDPQRFAGGSMILDQAAAEDALRRQIAEPLGLPLLEAAWGVHAVANANMERAMRSMSMDRGRDPRKYAMVAFGGAGPIHAARLGRDMGVPRVIIPWGAGVGSAIGLLQAEQRFTVSMTNLQLVTPESTTDIAAIYRDLESRARRDVEQLERIQDIQWLRFAFLRYAGQGYELKIDLPQGDISGDYASRLIAAFHQAYGDTYGYSQSEDPIEAADWYLTAVLAKAPEFAAGAGAAQGGGTPGNADGSANDNSDKNTNKNTRENDQGTRSVYFPEFKDPIDCPVVDRYGLAPGDEVRGPAIVLERESTTVILPGDSATVSAGRHLIIQLGGHS